MCPTPIAQPDAEQHLDRRAEDGDAAHRAQILERELDAERKEQQRHADLGQECDLVAAADGDAGSVRPDDDAGQDVAHDQRLAQKLRDQPADQRGDDDDGEVRGNAHEDSF